MSTPNDFAHDFRTLGLAVVHTESQAVSSLAERIDESFIEACNVFLRCKARVVVIGIGKSGHIGSKIAATLASTGTPSFFVHPGEASHGDMGMIVEDDVVLAISNSGETDEILTILPLIKRLGVPLVSLTGNSRSTIAKASTVNLDVSVAKEACPLGLAPTSSTTAALVMGDALAVALLTAKGISADDFARSHPGGRLGKRLLLQSSDIMHSDDQLPKVPLETTLRDAIVEMNSKSLGITAIVDHEDRVKGIITDGDLRRAFDKQMDVHNTLVNEIMTSNCVMIEQDSLAVDALQAMQQHKISALLIVDEHDKLVGALNMHDLLRAGVI
ncbi:KpsF/GutQ family sugar-phosphate isomerase [Candidatus Albibeggiatoa sp. nov. NOAA]|uniref:KpsF/GutQ family sugar-phosphate isomerase n=1 Tax=Candidatus Albibeggiatoa sp. nov. NOAA TaxID=3162724 RepID=UPI0032FFAA73|nr:KpsF/GutQ family sugar-phosphate isomerase [Thiotrichaceae bacterium]